MAGRPGACASSTNVDDSRSKLGDALRGKVCQTVLLPGTVDLVLPGFHAALPFGAISAPGARCVVTGVRERRFSVVRSTRRTRGEHCSA
jgi:hypothetical protein